LLTLKFVNPYNIKLSLQFLILLVEMKKNKKFLEQADNIISECEDQIKILKKIIKKKPSKRLNKNSKG
jgi:hypothetical protein